MTRPLVSVICLCYNHARFVQEAIESVINQTYQEVELIVVDDASTDDSASVITSLVKKYPTIKFISLLQNVGNCKAFNMGLREAVGDFVIDLAADDVLLPVRIEEGLDKFWHMPPNYGVHFSDVEWIDEQGKYLYFHSDRFPHHTIPEGEIYTSLIDRYFICSPSMMFRREVIDFLDGYDEALAYEDFDFWMRSSRQFNYCYTPKVLVKKRLLHNSMSKKQFERNNRQQESTFNVCKKILCMNRSRAEKQALQHRILYEMRVSLRLFHLRLFFRYLFLGIRNASQHYGR